MTVLVPPLHSIVKLVISPKKGHYSEILTLSMKIKSLKSSHQTRSKNKKPLNIMKVTY